MNSTTRVPRGMFFMPWIGRIAVAVVALAFVGTQPSRSVALEEWSLQFGTSKADSATGLWVDASGNAHVCGTINEAPPGSMPGLFLPDIFVAKFDSDGNQNWIRQLGSDRTDYPTSVVADSLGNTWTCGTTFGVLGESSVGGEDVFVAKFDPNGNILLGGPMQFGTSVRDTSAAVAVDASDHIFLLGRTYGSLDGPNAGKSDMFLRKLDQSGNVVWAKQFGSTWYDTPYDITVDKTGHAWVVGKIEETDVLIAEFNSDGDMIWTDRFALGSSVYPTGGIEVDSDGNVWVAGWMREDNQVQPFVRKYDANGDPAWTFVADYTDTVGVSDIALTADGGVWLVGQFSDWEVEQYLIYLEKLNEDGVSVISQAPAYTTPACASAVGTNRSEYVWYAGGTSGTLFGENNGGYDAFLVKMIDPIPEPSSLTLMVAGILLLALMGRARGHRGQAMSSE